MLLAQSEGMERRILHWTLSLILIFSMLLVPRVSAGEPLCGLLISYETGPMCDRSFTCSRKIGPNYLTLNFAIEEQSTRALTNIEIRNLDQVSLASVMGLLGAMVCADGERKGAVLDATSLKRQEP